MVRNLSARAFSWVSFLRRVLYESWSMLMKYIWNVSLTPVFVRAAFIRV